LLDLFCRAGDNRKCNSDRIGQTQSGCIERHTATRAEKKSRAEIILKALKLLSNSAGHNAKIFGGSSKAAAAGERIEGPKSVERRQWMFQVQRRLSIGVPAYTATFICQERAVKEKMKLEFQNACVI
jgi:hypothetical protein